MSKQILHTDSAPGAIGPYSQATRIADFVFTSGQLGIDPATGKLADGVQAQAAQSMRNIGAILAAAGLDYAAIVKTTIFVKDLADFKTVNDATRPSLRATIRRAAACRSPRCPWADWSRSSASRAPEARGAAGSKHIEWHLTSAHWQSARLRFAAASGGWLHTVLRRVWLVVRLALCRCARLLASTALRRVWHIV